MLADNFIYFDRTDAMDAMMAFFAAYFFWAGKLKAENNNKWRGRFQAVTTAMRDISKKQVKRSEVSRAEAGEQQ